MPPIQTSPHVANIYFPPPISESLIPPKVAFSSVGQYSLPSGVISSSIPHTPITAPNLDVQTANFSPTSPSIPSAQKQNTVNISKEEAVADFMKGFVKGLPQGSLDSIQKIPSTISTLAKAAANYVLDPLIKPLDHVLPGQEIISEAFAAHDTISYLVTCNKSELAKAVAPEVHQLCSNWDNLSYEERGSLIGFCVGEYGTDFLLPVAAAKGVKLTGRALKEVTTIGKIGIGINTAAKEVEAVEAIINASKSVKGSTPLAEGQTVVQKYLLSEELKKNVAEVLANTEKALLSEAAAEGRAFATKEAASLEARINTAGAQVGKETQIIKQPVRTEPRTLQEQFALQEAKAGAGTEISPERLTIKDPNYPTEDWAKMEYLHEGLDGSAVEIHFWRDRHTGETHGFKFKDKNS